MPTYTVGDQFNLNAITFRFLINLVYTVHYKVGIFKASRASSGGKSNGNLDRGAAKTAILDFSKRYGRALCCLCSPSRAGCSKVFEFISLSLLLCEI